MQINDQGTFYVEGEYKAGDIILTAGDWELKADVDAYKKYAFGYEPADFPELVTNGTFDTDLSGWVVKYNAFWEAGTLVLPRETGTDFNAEIYQVLTNLTVGATYEVSLDILEQTGLGLALYPFGRYVSPGYAFASGAAVGKKVKFVANATTMTVWFITLGTAGAGYKVIVDNISVRLAHPKSGDTIQLGNGHHRGFRYYPYKLSATDIQELTR
jgi:hypothetical protein